MADRRTKVMRDKFHPSSHPDRRRRVLAPFMPSTEASRSTMERHTGTYSCFCLCYAATGLHTLMSEFVR